MPFQSLNLPRPEVRTGQSLPAPQPLTPGNWALMFGDNSSDSGELVSEATALQVSDCFSAIRVIADAISALPLPLYRRTSQGRIRATDNPLDFLLTVEPNPEMTSQTFWHHLVSSMALTGNAYAEIERSNAGDVLALWPMNPNNVSPIRVNGRLAFRSSDGMAAGAFRTIASEDILHVPLFVSFDGVSGLSPLTMHRQTLGLALAVQKFSSRFYKNYSTPAVVLSSPKIVKPESKRSMRAEWEALQSGSNQHRVAILDQELSVTRLGCTPEESESVNQRKLIREMIAGIFGVPVHMLGDNQRLSQASAEQISLSFVQDTLMNYTSKLAGEIRRKLLRPQPGQAAEYIVEFDYSGRLAGDLTASANYFKTAIQFGWMTPNEVRRQTNLNEGPDSLNVYQVPVNMQNSERLLDPPKAAQPALPGEVTNE